MIAMSAQQAATHANCRLIGQDVSFSGLTTDSRAVAAGNLFVAIAGERFDGHEYVENALREGAVAALVSRPVSQCPVQLICDDTREALGQLASAWAQQCGAVVVGVTGSNGKTTIKSMLYEILSRVAPTLVNQGNFNNEIGMPLTMAAMSKRHRYAILEMGASQPGDIAYLAALGRPSVGIVSNASLAHTQGLGGVDDVAMEKGAMFAALSSEGVAIINADDDHYDTWCGLAGKARKLSFGFSADADIRCEVGKRPGDVTLATPVGDIDIVLQVPGRHNAMNAAAAAAAALALEVPAADIAAGLASFAGVPGRLQQFAGLRGLRLLDDTYNANPASLKAGISVLTEGEGTAWLVLGDMKELGDEAEVLHAQAGRKARDAGVDRVFAIGGLAGAAADAFGEGGVRFENKQALIAELKNLARSDITCLIKGSRSSKMEEVVQALKQPEQEQADAG